MGFTKSDLKTGDVCILNGDKGLVLKDTAGGSLLFFIEKDTWTSLSDLDDSLVIRGNPDYKVSEVYRPRGCVSVCRLRAADWKSCYALFFQRPPVVEMTLAEVCKALGAEIKIVKEH